jgi:hypothetical protein
VSAGSTRRGPQSLVPPGAQLSSLSPHLKPPPALAPAQRQPYPSTEHAHLLHFAPPLLGSLSRSPFSKSGVSPERSRLCKNKKRFCFQSYFPSHLVAVRKGQPWDGRRASPWLGRCSAIEITPLAQDNSSVKGAESTEYLYGQRNPLK